MGLDSIELVMEVEKAFKIKIPDREAEKIITVKDFYDNVWMHLSDRQTHLCKTQFLFYQLRKYFTEQFDIPKSAFQLNASVNDFVPADEKRKIYFETAANLNLVLPPLSLPTKWGNLLNGFGLITIGGSLLFAFVAINWFEYSKWWWLLTVAGIFFTSLVSKTLNPKRVIIEPDNLKDYIERVFTLNYTDQEKSGRINRQETELIIRQIIVDKIGVDMVEVIPDAKLRDDLGVD